MRRLVSLLFLLAAFSSSPAQAQSGASAEVDLTTGNIRVILGSNVGALGFETSGDLKFNTSATGRLIDVGSSVTLYPIEKDADKLTYFGATGMPAGDYVTEGILPKGLRTSLEPTDMSLTFSYVELFQPMVVPWTYYFEAVPEPSTLTLASVGLFSLAALRRRK